MYRLIQQNGSGKYYDRANEQGGHGGDTPSEHGAWRDPTPEERAEYQAHRVAYMRSMGAKLEFLNHDREQCPPDCVCPACLVRAMQED